MSYEQDTGYTPVSFQTLMNQMMDGINLQFNTTYTQETFVGTGYYKFIYTLLQKVQGNEVKTSEIFQKLQEYIALTNERIQRPSVSHPGLIDSFNQEGFTASVKPPDVSDRGEIFICVDTDGDAGDYATKKLQIANLIKDFVAAGMVTQGDQVESITLSNGQAFDFKFVLPDRIPVLLRMTAVKSENTLLPTPDDETIRQTIFESINERYRLGYNFEPQRYFTLNDAQWAETVLLEWTDDVTDGEPDEGAVWHSTVFDAEYDELFTFGLDDIQVILE